MSRPTNNILPEQDLGCGLILGRAWGLEATPGSLWESLERLTPTCPFS